MVQGLLMHAGIKSLINSESAPGLFPVTTGKLARQELMVVEGEAERARELIAQQYESGDELPPDDAGA